MKTYRVFIVVFVVFSIVFGAVNSDDRPGITTRAALAGEPAQPVNTSPPAEPVKLIFIHHSCGENWLTDGHGNLGLALRDNNYFVSDTNYGWGPDSIGDRTDIGHWYDWFLGPNRDTYLQALYTESDRFGDYYSRRPQDPGGENQIIMFKSCYPNSYLDGSPTAAPAAAGSNPLYGQESWSEAHTVANAKGIYTELLDYFAARPDKLFITVTAPPQMEGETDPARAANARAFNNWLVNDWLAGYPENNVAVFDFYNVLTSNRGDIHTHDAGADTGNHHRIWNGAVQHLQTVDYHMAAYPDGDSHPTPAGNQKATAEFVSLLNFYYNRWHSTAPAPPETVEEAPAVDAAADEEAAAEETAAEEAVDEGDNEEDSPPAEDAPSVAEPALIEGMIQQFSSAEEDWSASVDEQGSTIACEVDAGMGHQADGALQIAYHVKPDGWADCGHHFAAAQDWSRGYGLSLWMYAEKEGPATLMLFSGTPDAPTPFETIVEIPAESVGNWAEVRLPWSMFERAHWADSSGLAEMDLTHMTGLGINFWADSESNRGVVWFDDIGLAAEEIWLAEESSEAEQAEVDETSLEPKAPVETVPEAEAVQPEEEAPAATELSDTAAPIPATEEAASGGGLCSLSMVLLPLMLAGALVPRREQRI